LTGDFLFTIIIPHSTSVDHFWAPYSSQALMITLLQQSRNLATLQRNNHATLQPNNHAFFTQQSRNLATQQ
jgi:hypothetical protein